jgi:putative molybdopterin biosynthesis protein
MAAARALDLDCVPLLTERYDLVIPVEHYASSLLQPLLTIIRAETAHSFRQAVAALGGYETGQMGQVLAEL